MTKTVKTKTIILIILGLFIIAACDLFNEDSNPEVTGTFNSEDILQWKLIVANISGLSYTLSGVEVEAYNTSGVSLPDGAIISWSF